MLVSRTVVKPAAAVAGTVALVALAALSGCDGLAEHELTFDRTENVKVTEIEIAPGAGDVVVRTGPVTSVRIERVVRYRTDEPDETNYRFDGTKLLLDTDCGRYCAVSYDILAPQGVAVRGQNDSGSIRLTAVSEVDVKADSGSIAVDRASGAVRAETNSGEITLSGLSGTVSARTDSGPVQGRDLGAGKVRVETGSGEITLTLRTAGSVQARASSGSVTLLVPAGAYRVRTNTGSGTTDVTVPTDPTATAVLDAQTDSGSISVGQN